MKQYYNAEDIFLPKEILVSCLPGEEDLALLQQWLSEKAERKVTVSTPRRGDKAKLMQLACDNARKLIQEKERKGKMQQLTDEEAAEELQHIVGCDRPLARMDCFDISHNQGSETVSSMVVFRYGAPSKRTIAVLSCSPQKASRTISSLCRKRCTAGIRIMKTCRT